MNILHKGLFIGALLSASTASYSTETQHGLELGNVKGKTITYTYGVVDDDSYTYGSLGLLSLGLGYEKALNLEKDIT